MLILLPPSEGKTEARKGEPLRLEDLHFPELLSARRAVLTALAEASSANDAHSILGVGESLAADVRRNVILDEVPAAPAHDVYSGVLYDALDYAGMTAAQKRKAREQCVVVSALWGAIGFGDRIPPYRLSMAVDLPGTGRLAGYWKRHLADPLVQHAGADLVVDCRSSTYAAAWAPPVHQSAAVNVYQVRNGKRTVVSHFAKHTRGELARHLLTRRGTPPATPEALLRAARERWTAELEPASTRKPAQLSIILG
ncbi:peroxide stress protein YaaA [Arthrobacter sp. NamB2]|uniref:YaaA family protein n=1 Tax=Arthrobacter sp. NamB2 TaxID=2576035 RepID=UPI0010C94A32|nr:peroxide stress protein YaaA [Arthrobacter sp. NamB2]TKV29941.1 peroxide stress protein YaaA [Arthrobacter sp. NamB2]